MPTRRIAAGAAFTFAVLVVGLFIVKWSPYYSRTLTAAAHHSIGTSILAATTASGSPAGAALAYTRAYFLAIWQALVLAMLLGASVSVLIPRRWIAETLMRAGLRSAAVLGVFALGGMMCTCCTAPVVVGLRKQRASAAGAIALFIATPTLNPAVLLFIGFVLSWQYAALRLVAGLAIVLAVAWATNRYEPDTAAGSAVVAPSPIEDPQLGTGALAGAWLRTIWWEIRTLLPAYLIVVLVLGFVHNWIFNPQLLGGIGGAILAGLVGALFVIPTGAEVPILQAMSAAGIGAGIIAALLVALPALSLPSLLMLRGSFVPRTLLRAYGLVVAAAITAAGTATTLHFVIKT